MTTYVELTWPYGKTEKLALANGIDEEGIREFFLTMGGSDFARLALQDGSVVIVRLDQICSFRFYFEKS